MPKLFTLIKQFVESILPERSGVFALPRGDPRTPCTKLVLPPARPGCCNRGPPIFHSVTAMLDPRILDDLASRLGKLVSASPVADIEKNARALLATFFTKLDLVSREEFDIQTQVLQRSRAKLQELEERLDRLENPPESKS